MNAREYFWPGLLNQPKKKTSISVKNDHNFENLRGQVIVKKKKKDFFKETIKS